MAPSSGTFVIDGVKLSVDLLEKIAGDLPPPTSTVVGLVQQIIAIVETIRDNQEQCQQLLDRLLRLLLVVLAALKQRSASAQGQFEIPPELLFKIDRFKDDLGRLLKDVTKIHSIVNSTRKRDKLRAALRVGSYKTDIKNCYDQLDWAIMEFDVDSRLTDAIRLCTMARQVQKVLTNQYLEKLPIATYARFDCERPDRPTSCFPGTREVIIKEILAWIMNPDPRVEHFFWLNGLAGIGKTTIARTIAELAQSLGALGASFFFSRRGEAELRNPALVFPTIAHQLALFDHDFCEKITAAIEADAYAPSASLKQQLDRLIVEPLRGLKRDPERVVVVLFDAFDECESAGASTILQLLVAAMPSLPFFLKVFVTSRPELHIRSVLVPATNKLRITVLHNIEESVVKGDILLYLRASIRSLPEKKGLVMRSDWVTDEEIELLADAAGKLFIWAATAIRSLEEAYSLRRQLNILLRLAAAPRSEQDKSNPFVYLDELYTEVLRRPITPANEVQALEMLQIVLGSIVLLRNPLPVDALERLVDLESGEALATLNTLYSVILPPAPPDHCPRTYHPSFPDYLQDPMRCNPDTGFFIETGKHEARMAICCLNLLNEKLHKGMLGNLGSVPLNSEVEALKTKVDAAIPPELRYACRFWASHLAKVRYIEDRVLQAVLVQFAAQRLLPWLESMSWMGLTREAVDCLEIANTWVTVSSSSSVTTRLLNDVYRLLLAHFPVITESAMHIARSALPFAPRNTLLRAIYAEYAELEVLLGDDLQWSPCLMTWKSHSDAVSCVSISPDGSRVASGSRNNNIHIHDASGGGFVTGMVLTGNFIRVHSVAFSPDGKRVVSGSDHHPIQIWDATTGCELLKLEGHAGIVCSVAFSPDGAHIASGSRDHTIRVWNTITGDAPLVLEGHSGDVNAIAFFPDGNKLVSGSDDCALCIWDITSGTGLAVLLGHSERIWSVAVSPDGSRITSGSSDCTIRIWDASDGAGLATLRGHTSTVSSVAFSPGGDRIVSGSCDSSVGLWETATSDNIATFRGHTDAVRSVTFSPDGRRVISGSDDTTVRIWDANAFMETAPQGRSEHSAPVLSLAFSSDGTELASLDSSNNVHVWKLVECRPVVSFAVPSSHLDSPAKVHFSLDDTQVIVVLNNNSKIAFRASSGKQIATDEFSSLDVLNPIPSRFKVQLGKLRRTDVYPYTVVCSLPPSLQYQVGATVSFKLGGAAGDRVALGLRDGRVMVLDVAP